MAAPPAVAEDSHCCFLAGGFAAIKTQKQSKESKKKKIKSLVYSLRACKSAGQEYFSFFCFFHEEVMETN